MQYHKRGFTLIEVLAALVLLSLLVACIMPTWSRIRLAQDHIQDNALALEQILYLSNAEVLIALAQGSLLSKDTQYEIHAQAFSHSSSNSSAPASALQSNNADSNNALESVKSQHKIWVALSVVAHRVDESKHPQDQTQILAQCTRLVYLPTQPDLTAAQIGTGTGANETKNAAEITTETTTETTTKTTTLNTPQNTPPKNQTPAP